MTCRCADGFLLVEVDGREVAVPCASCEQGKALAPLVAEAIEAHRRDEERIEDELPRAEQLGQLVATLERLGGTASQVSVEAGTCDDCGREGCRFAHGRYACCRSCVDARGRVAALLGVGAHEDERREAA